MMPTPEDVIAWVLLLFAFIVEKYNISLRFRDVNSVLDCFVVV